MSGRLIARVKNDRIGMELVAACQMDPYFVMIVNADCLVFDSNDFNVYIWAPCLQYQQRNCTDVITKNMSGNELLTRLSHGNFCVLGPRP